VPAPHDPSKPEFYVYHLVANQIPFYVGIGRSTRASDRVRYVRYLMAREAGGRSVKWSLHTRIIAALLNAGCDIQFRYVATGMTRARALDTELSEISALLAGNNVLANIQHNPNRPKTVEDVTLRLLDRCGANASR
jgi:hypothetical protein